MLSRRQAGIDGKAHQPSGHRVVVSLLVQLVAVHPYAVQSRNGASLHVEDLVMIVHVKAAYRIGDARVKPNRVKRPLLNGHEVSGVFEVILVHSSFAKVVVPVNARAHRLGVNLHSGGQLFNRVRDEGVAHTLLYAFVYLALEVLDVRPHRERPPCAEYALAAFEPVDHGLVEHAEALLLTEDGVDEQRFVGMDEQALVHAAVPVLIQEQKRLIAAAHHNGIGGDVSVHMDGGKNGRHVRSRANVLGHDDGISRSRRRGVCVRHVPIRQLLDERGVHRVAPAPRNDGLRGHLKVGVAFRIVSIHPCDSPVVRLQAHAGGFKANVDAQLFCAGGKEIDEGLARLIGPPMEALERAHRLLVDVDPVENVPLVHKPIGRLPRRGDEFVPQNRVAPVVREHVLLFNQLRNRGKLNALLLLELAAPSEHALCPYGASSQRRPFLQDDDTRAKLGRAHCGAQAAAASSEHRDVAFQTLFDLPRNIRFALDQRQGAGFFVVGPGGHRSSLVLRLGVRAVPGSRASSQHPYGTEPRQCARRSRAFQKVPPCEFHLIISSHDGNNSQGDHTGQRRTKEHTDRMDFHPTYFMWGGESPDEQGGTPLPCNLFARRRARLSQRGPAAPACCGRPLSRRCSSCGTSRCSRTARASSLCGRHPCPSGASEQPPPRDR